MFIAFHVQSALIISYLYYCRAKISSHIWGPHKTKHYTIITKKMIISPKTFYSKCKTSNWKQGICLNTWFADNFSSLWDDSTHKLQARGKQVVDNRKKMERKKTALVPSGNCSNYSNSAILGVTNKVNYNVHNQDRRWILQVFENLLCGYNRHFTMVVKDVMKKPVRYSKIED